MSLQRYPALAGRVADQGVGGRESHQRADGMASAVHRARLEGLRETEQEDDRRRLRPFPQDRRAGDGNDHEDVDVERPDAQRGPGSARRRPDPGGHRQDEQPLRQPAGGNRTCLDACERQHHPDCQRRTRRPHERMAKAHLPIDAGAVSSRSSQARMPVSATASAIVAVEILAASYFT